MDRRVNAAQAVLGVFIFAMVAYAAYWVLAPTYASRPPAIRTVCLTNVKQTTLGSLLYSADYDEKFPDASRWVDRTVPYAKSPAIYHCPILSKSDYGYAFHDLLSLSKTPAGKDSTTVMIFESTDLTRNAHGTLTTFEPARHVSKVSGGTSSSNVGYADGHAKAIGTGRTP